MPVLANTKHERFAQEFVTNGYNGTRAAFAAGYTKKNSAVTASRLRRNPKVSNRIDELNGNITDKARTDATMSLEDIIFELDAIARSRLKDYIDLRTGDLKSDLADLPDDVQAAIASFERKWDPDANGGKGGWAYKIKIWDKLKALEMHARHKGMFEDKIKIIHNILDTVPQEEVDARMAEAEVALLEDLGADLILFKNEDGEYVMEVHKQNIGAPCCLWC